jgi:hypothetical protein
MGTKLGPGARSILDAGRDGDNPTAADRARVKRALMKTIAASAAVGASAASSAGAAGGGAAAAVAAKGTSIGLGLKHFGAALLASIALGGVVLQRSASPDPAANHAVSSDTASPAIARASAAPALVAPADAPPAKVAVADPARPDALAAAEKARAPMDRARSPVVAREPVDAPDEAAPAPVAAAAAPAIPAEDPLVAETRRLREAHGALQAGDAQKALALLGEEGGQLGEERAAARVLALCQLGKVAEMEAARAAFLRDHPRSPLASRVGAGCSNPGSINR